MDDATSRGPELLRKYSKDTGLAGATERPNDVPQPPNVFGRGRYLPSARWRKNVRSSMDTSVDESAQRKALERL